MTACRTEGTSGSHPVTKHVRHGPQGACAALPFRAVLCGFATGGVQVAEPAGLASQNADAATRESLLESFGDRRVVREHLLQQALTGRRGKGWWPVVRGLAREIGACKGGPVARRSIRIGQAPPVVGRAGSSADQRRVLRLALGTRRVMLRREHGAGVYPESLERAA